MKRIKKLFVFILIFGLFLTFVGCKNTTTTKPTTKPTTTTTTSSVKTYDISFNVNGVITKKVVEAGEMPSYGATPNKPQSQTKYYVFLRWDKEIVEASENTTYTAVFEEHNKLPKEVSFPSGIYAYDGSEKEVTLTNLPEDATVEYKNNKRTEPGLNECSAVVTYDGRTYSFLSTILIEKIASELTIDLEQTIESGSSTLAYSFNNTEQTIEFEPIYVLGSHYIKVKGAETAHYKASLEYEVKLNVVDRTVKGITFPSKTLIANGSEQVLLYEGTLEEGYHVEYANNKLTKQGKAYATCTIYNEDNEVVDVLKAIFILDNPVNEVWEELEKGFIVELLYDDYFAWNTFFNDPETSVGLDRSEFPDASWYKYEKRTPEDILEIIAEWNSLLTELETFDVETLSYTQASTYKQIKQTVLDEIDSWSDPNYFDGLFMSLIYITSEGGYVSNLTNYISEYKIKHEYDVQDLINYLKSSREAFLSYYEFALDKIEAGYPYSDYTIDTMNSFLDGIISQEPGEYYLYKICDEKIDNSEILEESDKVNYKALVKDAIENYFIPACETLKNNLETCKGNLSEEDEGYFSKYENGAELYTKMIRNNLGDSTLDIKAYGTKLKKHLEHYAGLIDSIISEYQSMGSIQSSAFLTYVNGGKSVVNIYNPDEMIDYLKHFALYVVKEPTHDVKVNIKYMDDTEAEYSNAQAYYMSSALDAVTEEYITLNRKHTGDDINNLLSVMAHEGYPGHLYAHVTGKETFNSYYSMIFDSTAFHEGWATYVQSKLYEYIKENSTCSTKSEKIAMDLAIDYMICNDMNGHALYTYVDYLIHIENYSIEQIADFMDSLGYNGGAAEEIFNLLIEMPASYSSYGYGRIAMLEAHETAKNRLGDVYNEVDFNTYLLSHSIPSLYDMNSFVETYIEDMTFLYK